VIDAHFLSHITYGLPVWGSCLTQVDVARLNTVIYKVMRIHCFDFNRRLNNRDLRRKSDMRNFSSLKIIYDSTMLHRLCRAPENYHLTTRLIQQSYFTDRQPGHVFFFDNSTKRFGGMSFINRSKRISELIRFPWPDLSYHAFKKRIKDSTPLMAWWKCKRTNARIEHLKQSDQQTL